MKRSLKPLCIVICLAMVSALFAGCGGKTKTLSFHDATLVAGKVGVAYSQSITATAAAEDGDPEISYSLKAGTLPAGLRINGNNIEGTPTETADAAKVTVVAKASGFADAEAEFTLSIQAGTLSYEDSRLPAAIVDEPYTQSVALAKGYGEPAVSYELAEGATLPAWLAFDAAAATISGTPTEKTTTDIKFSVTASAANYETQQAELHFAVISVGEIDYAGRSLSSAELGVPYTQSIATATAAGNPAITYTITEGSLPDGLTLSAAGLISGVPLALTTVAAVFKVTASAAGFDSAEAVFSLEVEPQMQSADFEAFLTNLDEFLGGGIGYGGFFDGVKVIETTGTGEDAFNGIPYNVHGTTGHVGAFFMQGMHRYFDADMPGDDGEPVGDMANTIEWNIVSSRQTKATLSISLGMEIITTQQMHSGAGGGGIVIAVNGEPVEYSGITLSRTSSAAPIQFYMYELNEIELEEGPNTITYTKGDNLWISMSDPGGPALDVIRIEARADVTWAPGFPLWENVQWNFPTYPIPE